MDYLFQGIERNLRENQGDKFARNRWQVWSGLSNLPTVRERFVEGAGHARQESLSRKKYITLDIMQYLPRIAVAITLSGMQPTYVLWSFAHRKYCAGANPIGSPLKSDTYSESSRVPSNDVNMSVGNSFVIIRIQLNRGSSRRETKLSASLSLYNVFFFTLTVVLLSTYQVLVKAGIQKAAISLSENFFHRLFPLLLLPLVLGGLLATTSSSAFIFTVLSEVNLSIVYPFISFSYLVVLTLSLAIFCKHISRIHIEGTLSILMGIYFLSRFN